MMDQVTKFLGEAKRQHLGEEFGTEKQLHQRQHLSRYRPYQWQHQDT
jgi:hypothetical protein